MERPYPSFEFEAEIDPRGTVRIPPAILNKLGGKSRVTMKITGGIVARSLRERNITEENVEHIAAMQLESRENVIRFLNAEGGIAAAKKSRQGTTRKGARR